MLQDEGVQALAVHCRTRAQGHKGEVDYSWIGRIKAAVQIPVILNGDIVSPQTALAAFQETGCDGVMIGRAAIRHPWLFREIRHHLETGELLDAPTLRERAEVCLHHLRLSVEHAGQRYGITSMRRHFAGYFRSLRGAAQLRAQLCGFKELEPLEARLQQLASMPDDVEPAATVVDAATV